MDGWMDGWTDGQTNGRMDILFSFYSCRYFNEFLLAHSRETAEQIRSECIDTLSKIYYSYFKDYYHKLMKLQVRETYTHTYTHTHTHTCT